MVVIDTLLKSVDFGFKRSRIRVRVVVCRSKIMPECGGCNRI